ncbi:MAG: MBOAT family O-acyltransferase [Planctomycetota bacterium]
MLFSEPAFLFLFLPVLLWTHWLIPRRLSNLLLAVVSLGFYAWGEKEYVVIMAASILLNYVAGRGVASSRAQTVRRVWLVVAVVGNLSILAFFKYADFIARNLNLLLDKLGAGTFEPMDIHLPIGISFFTFQSMSYVIDTYRRRTVVQTNPVNLALYVSLFPQLIAGPIVRYETIARQITHRVLSSALFESGVKRFIVGLAKKMIIANALAFPADQIFQLPADQRTMPIAWLGILCYTLQIYFDFSGYSDMAIGLGRMFGFRFRENFRYPYIARSVTEFWRRWHISLSSWFRDYLYIPLGGSRGSRWQTYRNLMLVFLLCGLWHGANWAFVAWGLYHGLFLVIERMGFSRLIQRCWIPLQHLYAMLVVMIGWVFFRVATGPLDRANPLEFGLGYCKSLFGWQVAPESIRSVEEYLSAYLGFVLLAGIVGSTEMARSSRIAAMRWTRGRRYWRALVRAVSQFLYFLVLCYCILLIGSDSHNPFIYFQF